MPHFDLPSDYIENDEEKRRRRKAESLRNLRIIASLGMAGIEPKILKGYDIKGNSEPYIIEKEGYALGKIFNQGYIEITYETGNLIEKKSIHYLRQINYALDLARSLYKDSKPNMVEVPPRSVVKSLVKRTIDDLVGVSEDILKKIP